MPFSSVLIGHGPQLIACAERLLDHGHHLRAVISDCPQVETWVRKKGIDRIESQQAAVPALRGEAFDYLFSIVNHAVTPRELLALPRLGAINFHDSRLPAYGGFNSMTWAILDGRTEHGITWHRMAERVDSGAVLVQKTFAITEDDTAFSLAARAANVALQAFDELLQALENGTLRETPPAPAQNFHFKSERPGFCVIDPRGSASDALRLVRALDFGREESWMSRAKLCTPGGSFVCVGSVTLVPATGAAPGTVCGVGEGSVELAVADGTLALSELTTLEGDALGAEGLATLGLASGVVLASPDKALAESVRALDAELTKSERYWVSRLVRMKPSVFTELRAQVSGGAVERCSAALPPAFLACTADAQRALLVAAVAGYVTRVGAEVQHVDLGLRVEPDGIALSQLFAPVVPLSLDMTTDTTLEALITRASDELSSAAKRRTYARDAWTRYPTLRGKVAAERALPVVLDMSEKRANALPEGAQLVVGRSADETHLELLFDSAALGPLHAERMARRLAQLMGVMAALGVSATQKLAALDIVTADERELLLETFQNTSRPAAAIACIHDLFAASVAQHPDKTAIVFRDQSLTYRELDLRANALAHELVKKGVGPDQLVAISIERSLHMMIGLLAILKAGGAYVPLDPAYPIERLSIMLEDSGARWLLTQKHLATQLPKHGAEVLFVEEADRLAFGAAAPACEVRPEHLAYVIFTSGSTGRPKGVMVEHRNVANFFAGMDERVGTESGTWLAVTSISFDISVLELFWTLSRGFEVVIQEETDRASVRKAQHCPRVSSKPMDFGLFYFAADSSTAARGNAYRLLLEGARFADTHDFLSVWTPERHFHAFGGLYPNPAVTSAAVAAITSRVQIRAGSVVIPLHDPIRVAEEWAVVDNLSNGRVGLSFASGWHANDFALKPDNYERRREVMQESIDIVLRLWAGGKVSVKNGTGDTIEVGVLPRPIRERPPMWIASAGNVETFRSAGRAGYNILTNMLGQDIKDLSTKFAAYREARTDAGHAGAGSISVMLHTFVTDSDDRARELARGPFGNYLKSSYDLVKVAPWMFPAFKQPSLAAGRAGADAGPSAFDPSRFDDSDMEALLDHAFDRYFDTAGLFGTPERALLLIEQLKEIGAAEVACLIDFGIDPDVVLDNLIHLDELRVLANSGTHVQEAATAVVAPVTIREQFERHRITHFQCTPSMARMLVADGTLQSMGSLKCCLLGGETLPTDLADTMISALPSAQVLNMYGPTETTVWSSTDRVVRGQPVSIGTPIANTQIRILDRALGLVPLGTAGELCIGGWSVVRGYFGKPELTAERFVSDPFVAGNRLYRTGDLARFMADGRIEYIGRIDQQVKVNGYRIELGEIETVLNRHAAVKEAVVAVKDGAIAPELVGYVIPAGGSSEGAAPNVDDWKQRWNEAYSQRAGAADAAVRFDTSGWLDSYTGAPIPGEHMREWLDVTLERIRALNPKRVLEIGCGTGMILYSLLPHVEHYSAVDLSPHALETIRKELSAEERRKVTLLNQAAHELDAIADQSVNVVVINSVAQYFPSADYLLRVLERVSRCVVDGGAVFLGDVRALEEETTFHTLVEVEKAPGASKAAALSQRIEERRELEAELLVGVPFFSDVEQRIARLGVERIQLKRGGFANEMRDFRSDVTLRVGPRAPKLSRDAAPVLNAPVSVDALLHALRESPALLWIVAAKNSRIDPVLELRARMTSGQVDTVDELRALPVDAPKGIDPNALFALDGYDVELRFGEALGTFDALLRNRAASIPGVWAPRKASGATTSSPHVRLDADDLTTKLRKHLREFLPEYMVPQSFMLLSTFPLTPNGKIDRKALPKPTEKLRQATVEFALPSNDLEHTIAEIWRSMLGVERVGRKDNIFDLGASSLLTVEANNRLQTALGRKIPLVTMFRYPTIESLANHLERTTKVASAGGAAPVDAKAVADQERQSRLAEAANRRRRARGQAS